MSNTEGPKGPPYTPPHQETISEHVEILAEEGMSGPLQQLVRESLENLNNTPRQDTDPSQK